MSKKYSTSVEDEQEHFGSPTPMWASSQPSTCGTENPLPKQWEEGTKILSAIWYASDFWTGYLAD